jgi:hypothetical protein
LVGPREISYKRYLASSASQTSVEIDMPPGNRRIIVDKALMVKIPVTIVGIGTTPGPGAYLYQSGKSGFKSRPLSKIISNGKIDLNGSEFGFALQDEIGAIERYDSDLDQQMRQYSIGPSMKDPVQRYANCVNTVKNPLGAWGDNSILDGRGAYPMTLTANSTTGFTINCDLYEYLYISPLGWGKDESSGFTGLDSMQLTLNFGNLANIWSHFVDTGYTLTSLTVTLGQVEVYTRHLTPLMTQPSPTVGIYPYHKIQQNKTAMSALVPNATGTVSSSSVNLSYVPAMVLIYIKRKKSERTHLTTDSFISLTNVSIDYDNRNNLFASARQVELFQVARKNRCNQSFAEWSGSIITENSGTTSTSFGLCGGPLLLEFGKDIPLDDGKAPGVRNHTTFQCTVQYKNTNQVDTITPELNVTFIYSGTLQLFDGQAISDLSVLSNADVMNAITQPGIPEVSYNEIREAYGGQFFRRFKDFGMKTIQELSKAVKKAEPHVRKALPVIKKGIKEAGPYIKTGVELAQMLAPLLSGVGVTERRKIEEALSGGQLVGGKSISKSKLRNRLRR